MQSSIASIFKVCSFALAGPGPREIYTQIQPMVNPRKAALAERKESEEPDSDVEVTSEKN
jgi:hypothetical protein